MRGYVGRMKVAIVAFGHADNIVCLAKALSRYLDVTIFFVVSGNRFVASIFDWDISKLPIGLITDSSIVERLIGNKIHGYIGSAVKIFDYLACGRPVVMSDIGSTGRLFLKSEAVELVKPEDPEGLSQAIITLLQDGERREGMGRKDQEYVVKFFDRRKIAGRIVDISLELLRQEAREL